MSKLSQLGYPLERLKEGVDFELFAAFGTRRKIYFEN
jgi:hypothetical protein